MAASMNQCNIAGNLGGDPEAKGEGSVCTFNVAANERWTDKEGELQEHTEWFKVVCFGRLAENCLQYLSKGSAVMIPAARKRTRTYEDDNGDTKYITEFVARDVQFLSSGAEGGDSKPAPKARKAGRSKMRGRGKKSYTREIE